MVNEKAVTCGIDIGSESTKVVLGPTHGCEIVRNEVGGHTSQTAVSFSEKTRQIGTTANVKGKNAIIHINRLLAGEMEDCDDPFEAFYLFEHDNEGVTIEYDGASRSFQPAAVVAMLLGKVRQLVLSTMQRVSGQPGESFDISYFISAGPNTTKEAQTELLDAAFAAGMKSAAIVETSICYSHAFQRKFPEHMDGRTIMIVDVGHTHSTVSVLKMGSTDEDQKEDEAKTPPTTKLLSSIRHKSLGGGSVDIRLWHHFQSTIPGLQQVTKRSRSGQRLLEGSKKLKHLLSQLPDGSVTVENVGQNDTDVKLTASRASLAEICLPDAQALSDLIKTALAEAGFDSVAVVEAVGGGCRIPWVQSTIVEALGGTLKLSHSLDDTSASLGAALIGSENPAEDLVLLQGGELTEVRAALLDAELAMALLDNDMQVRADTMNKIEAHILEMRSAKHSTHGSLLPATLDAYLDELDDWMFSDDAIEASKESVASKLKEAVDKTNEMCQEYFHAVHKDAEAKEREIEDEAQKAQLVRAGDAEEDEEDHDNRRLPKKRRMEIVMKNKAEANELFSDGNFKFAAARYTKALSHCAKFVDLSPDDQNEVNGVRLSLNLNLALAYIKLEKPDQALRVCNDAIALDESSAKALYRRASVYYEKKDWDSAYQDVEKAALAAPDDKAIQKLKERIEVQKKRQRAKEKKMAQKMFG